MENEMTLEQMEMALIKCGTHYPEMLDVIVMLQQNDLQNSKTISRALNSIDKTVDTITELSKTVQKMSEMIIQMKGEIKELKEEIKEMKKDDNMEDVINIHSEMTYGDKTIKVLCDGRYNGIKFWIMNVRGSHPCGYIEVPEDHPYYNLTYQEGAMLPVHGGVTFSEDHLSGVAEDTWILGWDYGHSGDKTLYFEGERHYVADIIDEIKEAINFLIEQ